MSDSNADRNLLFGILALQVDFITREQLIECMHAWVMEKTRAIAEVFEDKGYISNQRRAVLETLLEEHLQQHANDPQQSLAACSSMGSVRHELDEMSDPALTESLAHLAAETWIPEISAPQTISVVGEISNGDRFRVLRPHARGGLGQVSVALDRELHREIALKEILPQHADHPDSKSRFLIEAEVTGRLEHPGIVPVYGLGKYSDGRPYYAMRFIRGESLKSAIKQFYSRDWTGQDSQRILELRNLLGRFIDVCNAIAYAHSRGVLHRDIKPANIMLGDYGETLVVDWGLAKMPGQLESTDPDHSVLRLSSGSDSDQTLPGTAIGTPAYMSPEQAKGRLDELGPATDVYSLGATLYELLTNKPPIEGKDVGEVLHRATRGDIVPPRQSSPNVPKPLGAICQKAMAIEIASRYPSPSELASDIEKYLADEPTDAYREPLNERLRRWLRTHKTLSSTILGMLLVVIVGSVVTNILLERSRSQIAQQKALVEVAKQEEEQLRIQAEQHRDNTEKVLEVLVDILQSPDPDKDGRDVTVAELSTQTL